MNLWNVNCQFKLLDHIKLQEKLYFKNIYENKKIKRMKANFEQSANSSTTRLHERLYGTGSLRERKNYGLLKMKAQKRHKSIKRKHCGDGGSFTLACSTTYKVIEELLSIPIRF